MSALKSILENKLVAILRGYSIAESIELTGALIQGGIRNIEITLNTANALKSISELHHQFKDQAVIGAGTVLNAADAKEAIIAGAQFIISPSINPATIHETKKLGAVSIPGGFSPTEILLAYSEGADIVKVFPSTLGPEYITSVRGPFPQIPLMPTGGVTLKNIPAFLKAGAVAFGIGSALLNSAKKGSDRLKEIELNAAHFVGILKIKR